MFYLGRKNSINLNLSVNNVLNKKNVRTGGREQGRVRVDKPELYKTKFYYMQGINCFLKHTFLIADNDIRSTKLQQSFQTIITINDSSVQIIQVRCRKTSTIQLYHRTKIWRDYRNNIKNHPLRTVS